jgi:hypothetical protein
MILFAISLVSTCFAGFSEIDDAYSYEKPPEVKVKRASIKKKKSGEKEKLLRKLIEEDRKLAQLLEKQNETIIVRKKSLKVASLSRMEGTILNSILAMNVAPAKFLVKLDDSHELIGDMELLCSGVSFHKRVPAKCTLMSDGEREFKVDAEVWDLDGASGVVADYYYTSEEKAFLSSSLSSFLGGIVGISKERLATPFGEVTRDSAKNRVLSGLGEITNNASEKIKASANNILTISYVNAGRRALIFFNKSVDLTKENK